MRNCEECIFQIKGSCSKFECEETTIEQFEQETRNKVIDEFAHELKETFNQETPRNISCYEKYFALDDCRMWVDVIANRMKRRIE